MRRDAKADRNQPLFTAALRALDFLVQPIHQVGQGAPDLIVSGLRGNVIYVTLLIELKCNTWTLPPPRSPLGQHAHHRRASLAHRLATR